MKDEVKIKLLKEAVSQKRQCEEERKAVNETILAKRKEMEEQILEGGTINVAKEKYLEILDNEILRKNNNAKIKRLTGAIEKIITGEGDYDDEQLTLEDFMAINEDSEE